MKTFVWSGAGALGAAVVGLSAWVFRIYHGVPGNAGHTGQLLYGVDEYWNGEPAQCDYSTVASSS